jgi:putative DNA primase/helicase
MTAFDINSAVAHPLSADERLHAANDATPEATRNIVMPIPADAPQPKFRHPKYGKPSATWSYRDASGALLGYVCRFDPPFPLLTGEAQATRKQIVPHTYWRGKNGPRWRWKSWPEPGPLYGLD